MVVNTQNAKAILQNATQNDATTHPRDKQPMLKVITLYYIHIECPENVIFEVYL